MIYQKYLQKFTKAPASQELPSQQDWLKFKATFKGPKTDSSDIRKAAIQFRQLCQQEEQVDQQALFGQLGIITKCIVTESINRSGIRSLRLTKKELKTTQTPVAIQGSLILVQEQLDFAEKEISKYLLEGAIYQMVKGSYILLEIIKILFQTQFLGHGQQPIDSKETFIGAEEISAIYKTFEENDILGAIEILVDFQFIEIIKPNHPDGKVSYKLTESAIKFYKSLVLL